MHDPYPYIIAIANKLPGDLSKASAKVKSEIPGRSKEAQKDAEKWASEAGSKVDSAVSDLKYSPLYIAIYQQLLLRVVAHSKTFSLTRPMTNSSPQ
jgi:hypothetical protein